jgi:hypothetical protein
MTGFGWDPSHSIVKARQEGLQTVLYKPFRADRLLAAVEQTLRPPAAAPADGQAPCPPSPLADAAPPQAHAPPDARGDGRTPTTLRAPDGPEAPVHDA